MKKQIPEILAPCGSYEILTAAINAGADACYIGGSKFGARAYAENLDTASYEKAIDYAHLHNVRIYLTVNTLLKDTEITKFCDYIIPYYEAGIDAAIVQDLGVFRMLRNEFPDLKLHCSTQMNITSRHAAAYMKSQGATRVVTAREMSLEDIRDIKDNVDIEVESFVHGAMCYAYSGQCLLSSHAGERSGNRGRCAQPCRKCYNNSYLLSMKDMCALEIIPQIIDAGIDSLKIEGRMKNAYYVASAVDAYKELATAYIEGSFDISRAYELKQKLANVYNRGGFCTGYYTCTKGPDMISSTRPNNQGVCVGTLCDINSGKISLKLTDNIYKGDILELKDGIEITVPENYQKGDAPYLNAPGTKSLSVGASIYRTRCNYLLDDINKNIINNKKKIAINGYLRANIGEKLSFTVRTVYPPNDEVTILGDVIGEALNKAPDADNISKKLSQTGDTDFFINELILDIDDNAFVPAGMLKPIRRQAIDELTKRLTDTYKKKTEAKSYKIIKNFDNSNIRNNTVKFRISVISLDQLKIIVDEIKNNNYNNNNIEAIYIDIKTLGELKKDIKTQKHIKTLSIKLFLRMPYKITRSTDVSWLNNDMTDISGIYVTNIDSYTIVMNSPARDRIASGELELVIGFSLYSMNSEAISFLGPYIYEAPQELTLKELSELYNNPNYMGEYPVYGYKRAMLSEQCVLKNTDGCKKHNPTAVKIKKITDDNKRSFYAQAVCDECVNVIYNGTAYNMLGKIDEVQAFINPVCYRIDFTIEDAALIRQITGFAAGYNIYSSKAEELQFKSAYTTGHNYRGVL